MNILILASILAGASDAAVVVDSGNVDTCVVVIDAGMVVTVDAGQQTVSSSGAASLQSSSADAALSGSQASTSAPNSDAPIPADSEVSGMVKTLVDAIKSKNYFAAAAAFALLVLWLAKKVRKSALFTAASEAKAAPVAPVAVVPEAPASEPAKTEVPASEPVKTDAPDTEKK